MSRHEGTQSTPTKAARGSKGAPRGSSQWTDDRARKLMAQLERKGLDDFGRGRALSKVFKALSDDTRQEILRLLENDQRTVGEIVVKFNLSTPTISRHLSVLKEADLVLDQRQGQRVTYRLNSEALASSMQDFLGQFRSVPVFPPSVGLQEIHDPATGRIDAAKVAAYLKIPLRGLAGAMRKNYSAVHKTPASPALQPFLRSVKRTLEILEDLHPDRAAVLAWLNQPLPDLGGRAPLDVMLQGYPDAVEDMLEGALMGDPA